MTQALRDWCEANSTTSMAYNEPGSPWENGFAESLNGRFRDVFLNTELLTTAPEAQLLADRCATRSGLTRPSRGVGPSRLLNRELPHDHDQPPSSGLGAIQGSRQVGLSRRTVTGKCLTRGRAGIRCKKMVTADCWFPQRCSRARAPAACDDAGDGCSRKRLPHRAGAGGLGLMQLARLKDFHQDLPIRS